MRFFTKNVLATETESFLLNACISSKKGEVIDNLMQWKYKQDFDLINQGSYRLMPILFTQIRKFSIDDPNISLYKGIYKKWWVKNKQLFHETLLLHSKLVDSGIPTLVLKGLPLTGLYYLDNAKRPMSDVDILVPIGRVADVQKILKDNGWKLNNSIEENQVYKFFIPIKHSVSYSNEKGYKIDIHWKPLHINTVNSVIDQVWVAPQKFKIYESELSTPSDEFHFFQSIVHGNRRNQVSSIRWIVDSLTILKVSGASLEWEKIIQLTKDYHAATYILPGLEYLQKSYNASIPDWVISQISEMPIKMIDRIDFWFLNLLSNRFHKRILIIMYQFSPFSLYKLRSDNADWEALPFFKAYLKYLCLKLLIDDPKQLPMGILRKIYSFSKASFK